MEKVILETKNLSFHDTIHYQDIQIQKGKVNFIVGRSGTGKSTLLRLFNGTLTPSGGEIWYQGRKISEIDTIELRKDVSLISQSVYLFDTSIQENFRQFYEYRGIEVPAKDRMVEYLQMCQISFPLDKDCTTMSGGERQRVYIAIFLSFLPKVIMLDEPTSALDKENSKVVIQNIIDFCREKEITIIIVSHDNQIVNAFAENIILIGDTNLI
ncbi:MAG TPA: ABC transporter [Porphyromonadaceae bacterium]|jgi:putative ABC transport system ATP-binding protein|nr:ABC transporter [Lachnospiraceae bacterium]HBT86472.1 ABC transporter [Porphyromonadaceae bacterium]HBY70742.1 ABC transporter [Lachnospiraceae bacterium]HCA70696.1 ABC transporter [Lachnospiraceae bacterium]HCM13944.1 ABC transporter [Lachnospiraceae bacterium]